MEKLWVTDKELIERSGVPQRQMQLAIQKLDADRLSGFPRKNPLYDNRRYWPAVLKYWEVINPIATRRGSSHEAA